MDLDAATESLYRELRDSPRHGPFIASLEAMPGDGALNRDLLIAVVPGGFHKENPSSGADGRLVCEAAAEIGLPSEIVPLTSFGAIETNVAILARWLHEHRQPIVLVSLSKGTMEIRRLLSRREAPELLADVSGWVDLSGLWHGTPLVGWLRRRLWRWWMLRLLFWLKGYCFEALRELDRDTCSPWPDALSAVPHITAIHVLGFPRREDLTSSLARRGHRRLANLGPNDSAILLDDVWKLPGLVYPVWGADHYLRPGGQDMKPLVKRVLTYLLREGTRRSANEDSTALARR